MPAMSQTIGGAAAAREAQRANLRSTGGTLGGKPTGQSTGRPASEGSNAGRSRSHRVPTKSELEVKLMANDFYLDAAAQRADELAAERQAHLADLAAYRANGEIGEAARVVQALANNQAEQQNLQALCNDYVAAQQPRQPERISEEERAAKPWSRMNYDDVLEMARGSKYAKDLTWNADMQAGYNEVRARRARGE
jgi:hypothetical protein